MSPKLPRRASGSWPTWRSPHHSPWKGSVVLSRFATVRPPCSVVSGRSSGPATQNDSASAAGDTSVSAASKLAFFNMVLAPPREKLFAMGEFLDVVARVPIHVLARPPAFAHQLHQPVVERAHVAALVRVEIAQHVVGEPLLAP